MECYARLPKLDVAGSIPVARSIYSQEFGSDGAFPSSRLGSIFGSISPEAFEIGLKIPFERWFRAVHLGRLRRHRDGQVQVEEGVNGHSSVAIAG